MNERELLVDCLRRLNRTGVTYYLTGSMASNYWGIPRSTHDLDFVVHLRLGAATQAHSCRSTPSASENAPGVLEQLIPLAAVFEENFAQQPDGRATVAQNFVVKLLQGVGCAFLLLVIAPEF